MAFSVSEYKSVFSRVCILHPKKVVNVLIVARKFVRHFFR